MCAGISGALTLAGCANHVPGEPISATYTRYTCQARSATGATYTQFRANGQPFSVSVPQLPGWRSSPTALRENQLALTKTIGDARSYVTMSVLRPQTDRDKAFKQLGELAKFDSSVAIVEDETVDVCGLEASRLVGIAEDRGLRFEYLNLTYSFDGNYYPLQLRGQMAICDFPFFGVEIETMFRHLQIGP